MVLESQVRSMEEAVLLYSGIIRPITVFLIKKYTICLFIERVKIDRRVRERERGGDEGLGGLLY